MAETKEEVMQIPEEKKEEKEEQKEAKKEEKKEEKMEIQEAKKEEKKRKKKEEIPNDVYERVECDYQLEGGFTLDLFSGQVWIHNILRRNTAHILTKLEEIKVGDANVIPLIHYISIFNDLLHHHHDTEEQVMFPGAAKYGLDCKEFVEEHQEMMKTFDAYISLVQGLLKTKSVSEEQYQQVRDGMKEIKRWMFPHLAKEESTITRKWIADNIPAKEMPGFMKRVEGHGKKGKPECVVMMLHSTTEAERNHINKIFPWILKKVLLPLVFEKKVRDCRHLFIHP